MSGGEEKSLRNARRQLRAACVVIRALLVACLVFFIAVAVFSSVLCAMYLNSDDEKMKAITYTIVHRVLLSGILLLAILGLSDTIRGESPFTMKQSKRFWIAGILFLCVVVLDFLLPVEYSIDAFSDVLGTVNFNTMSSTGFVNLDVGSLLGSFASFCFAIVFKYGVLLQQESDEIV